jgi:hypothetical protein
VISQGLDEGLVPALLRRQVDDPLAVAPVAAGSQRNQYVGRECGEIVGVVVVAPR